MTTGKRIILLSEYLDPKRIFGESLVLWCDTVDLNTITTNPVGGVAGATVAVWADRSGKGHPLLQANGTLQPSLSRPDNKGNLLVQSEEFQTTWSGTRASIPNPAGINADTGPFGTGTADKLVEDGTASATHYIRQLVAYPAGTYCFSVWVKPSERSVVRLGVGDLGANYGFCYFNVATGTAGSEAHAGAVTSGAGEVVGSVVNGYFLCKYTFTCNATIASSLVAVMLADNTPNSSYNGDSTSGLFLGGASLRPTSWDSDHVSTLAVPIRAGYAGKRLLYFPGVQEYLKTAAFTLAQPVTDIIVGAQDTWTLNDTITDGNTANTGRLYQSATTPRIRQNAGSASTENAGLVIGTVSVIASIFNGASSSTSINNGTPVVSDAGSAALGGLTLGALADGTAPFNGRILERITVSKVMNSTEHIKIYRYLKAKYPALTLTGV